MKLNFKIMKIRYNRYLTLYKELKVLNEKVKKTVYTYSVSIKK